MNLSLHRSAQLARSHEPNFASEEAPDVHALCTDHVKPNGEGHKDLRASLSFMIQLRVSILREYSTLTSELFATATQRPDKRGKSKTDSSHRPTNRDLYLQMVDLVGGSLNGDIPEAEVAAILEESRVVERPTADLSAIDKAHIPTGQGYFLKKQQQQRRKYPRLQKKGCYLKVDAGVCSRDKCNFDHSDEVIRETKKSPHFLEWKQRAGHQSRQLSQATLASVADYHARAELAAQSAPPSSPVEVFSEEESGED